MLYRKKINKKAQLGEAITWVVATIIVFVILVIFIYAANAMGKLRSYFVSGGQASNEVGSMLKTKTELAFNLNNQNKIKIENWIKGVGG